MNSGRPTIAKSMILAAILALAAPAAAADPLAPLDKHSGGVAAALGPNVLGTVALRAGVTIYDARFRRVARTDASAPAVLAAAAPLRGLAPTEQLARAKRLVEARVRFGTDAEVMKVADLWANAGETLERGRGDEEDIAIAEMQVLKAAGFPAQDLYLTIGRHRQGAHIVLMARTPQGYFMLDRLLAAPVRADRQGAAAFKPVVSVGQDGSWVHGYRSAFAH